MFKKKYMILLSLILVSLCALSCVSASEDADAAVAIDDADVDLSQRVFPVRLADRPLDNELRGISPIIEILFIDVHIGHISLKNLRYAEALTAWIPSSDSSSTKSVKWFFIRKASYISCISSGRRYRVLKITRSSVSPSSH